MSNITVVLANKRFAAKFVLMAGDKIFNTLPKKVDFFNLSLRIANGISFMFYCEDDGFWGVCSPSHDFLYGDFAYGPPGGYGYYVRHWRSLDILARSINVKSIRMHAMTPVIERFLPRFGYTRLHDNLYEKVIT